MGLTGLTIKIIIIFVVFLIILSFVWPYVEPVLPGIRKGVTGMFVMVRDVI